MADPIEGVTPGIPGAETAAGSQEAAPAPSPPPLADWRARLRRGLRRHEEERQDELANPPAPAVPERYAVVREVGRGGMGVVLEAEDRLLRRRVALKVQREGLSERARRRFQVEAELSSQLEHPNIVPIHDLSADCLSMRFVEGESLGRVLDRLRAGEEAAARTWALPRLLEVLVAVTQAVGYAHSRGVVHRDIKPQNVMLGPFGEVFLMDFGLAKVLGQDEPEPAESSGERVASSSQGEAISRAGDVLGTPAYMAPEQARGEPADRRTDVYALGGLLYEMLTLAPPVQGESVKEVLERVASIGPLAPRARAPGRAIPRELDAICRRCLALDPAARYPGTDALLADLRAWQEGRAVSAWRDPLHVRLLKAARRHRQASAAVGAALLVSLAGGAFFGVWRYRQNARELASARELAAAREAQLQREQELSQVKAQELKTAQDLAAARETQLAREQELSRVKAEELARLQRRQAATPHYLTGRDLLRRRLDRKTIAARALPPLEQAVAQDPSFAEALFALGEAWWRVGRGKEAVRRMQDALELEPENAHWLIALGDLFSNAAIVGWSKRETSEKAADYYRRAAALGPELTPFARIGEAYLLHRQRKLVEAAVSAEQARKAAPHLWEAWRCEGVVAYARARQLGGNRWDKVQLETARVAYEQALRLEPDEPWTARGLAGVLTKLDRPADAVALLDRIVALEPEESNSYASRGLALTEAGRLEEARKDFDRAVELDRDNAPAFYNRGLLRRQLRDYQGAIDDWTRAIELDPTDEGPWTSRGNLLGALGKLEQAESDLTRAMEVSPDNALHPSNRALIRLQLKKFDAGRADARKAIEMDPAFVGGWVHLGMIEEAEKGRGASEAVYTEGIEKTGGHAHLYMYRGQGRIYAKPPRTREGLDDLLAAAAGAAKAQPPLPDEFWFLLGQAHMEVEEWPEALAVFKQHAAKVPKQLAKQIAHAKGECHEGLARRAAAANDAAGALAHLNDAMDCCPHASYLILAAEVAAGQGDVEPAWVFLGRAAQLGLRGRDRKRLEESEPLAPLRADPRWAGIVEKKE